MREAGHVHGLVEQLQVIHLPMCPRMRPARTRWFAVEGCCIFGGSPGRLMIPTVEIFQRYCTTARFRECPWSAKREENIGPVIDVRPEVAIRAEA